MKEIKLRCGVNPRVFYELFGSQEEAFNLAGVPYSDEARSKVEKANVARKFGKSGIISRRPSTFLKSAFRNLIISKNEERYVDKYSIKRIRMMDKLSSIYSKYHQLNPSDQDSILIAYNNLSSFIANWYNFLLLKDQQYEQVKAINNSTNPDKYNLPFIGYDLNDIEGSYNKICENHFTDRAYSKELYIWDVKAKKFFKLMLDEVFGSPPDLKTGG